MLFFIGSSIGFSAIADDNSTDLFSLSLQELIDIQVIGPTRTRLSLSETPAAISVYTQSEIRHLGVRYLDELASRVPGFQSQRVSESSVAYSVGARGRRNNVQSSEILVIIDGRNVTDPRTGAFDALFKRYPLYGVKRIEFIRGPGSALYGANAYSGVINIETLSGNNEIIAEAGGHEHIGLTAMFARKLGDWTLDIHAKGDTTGGERYALAFERDQAAQKYITRDPNTRVLIDIKLADENTLLGFTKNYVRSTDFYVLSRANNDVNDIDTNAQQFYFRQRFNWYPDIATELSLSHIGNKIDINAELASVSDISRISAPEGTEGLFARGELDGESYQIKLHNDWVVNDQFDLQFGVEWKKEIEKKAEAATNYDLVALVEGQFPVSYFGAGSALYKVGLEGKRHISSIYGQSIYKLTDDTNFIFSARFDDFSDTGSKLNPRIGVVHMLNDNNSLKLLYGEAFRAPSLSETQLINNPVVLGNIDLTHETVKTWDLIWFYENNQNLVTANWFSNRYTHPIRAELLPQSAILKYQNVGSENSQGLEVEASRQFNERVLVRASAAYLYELPDSAFRESDLTGSFSINYERHPWDINISGVFRGKREHRFEEGRYTLSPNWQVDGNIMYHFNESVTLGVNVTNIFDSRSYSSELGNLLPYGVINPGRRADLVLSWQF